MDTKRKPRRPDRGAQHTIRAQILISLMLVGAMPSVESASIDAGRLPPNLAAVTPQFHPLLLDMWKSSSTFRRQCARIAAADQLTVRLFVDAPKGRSSPPARTIIRHRNGRPVTADVYLWPTSDTVQLIAHEMEHIIEQLDRVDLHARIGSGSIWNHLDDFETIRAVEIGRRVAREVREASIGGLRRDGSIARAVPIVPVVMTVVQQNDRSAELDPRAARTSANGRYVAFASFAQLDPADRNRVRDIYVMDLWTRQVTLESQGSHGAPANGESLMADVSGDGRFVVFESHAGNLLGSGMPSAAPRVYLRDRKTGAIRLLTAAADGAPPDAPSESPSISADGTTVVFASAATNLRGCRSDGHRRFRLYLLRHVDGTCMRVDVSSAGEQQEALSATPSVSGDGRYVAFMSRADLTCSDEASCPDRISDRNGVADVYVRDFATNVTVRVSRSQGGGDPDGPSYQPAISSDGRHVVFVSEASNLVGGVRTRVPQVYVHDMTTRTTELVSHTPRGRPANGASLWPAVSADGMTIALQSRASDLICGADCPPGERDINLLSDVFMYDRTMRRMIRVSRDAGEEWMEYSRAPSVDDNGCVVVFASPHPIAEPDRAHDEDLYVGVLASNNQRACAPRESAERHRDGRDDRRKH